MFRTLSLSRSHGLLPDLDAPSSYFTSSTPSLEEMEQREREREKQKLLNMSIDYSSYSPISSYDKPTNFTRPNHTSTFDGLCIPYGNTNDLYDDPWSIKREKQEWGYDIPPAQPELMKSSSAINPFHTEMAPSLVFPYDGQPQQIQTQHETQPTHDSIFTTSDPISPFMMSDSEDDDMLHNQQHAQKRQRGEHGTVYIKQEPEDQDLVTLQDADLVPYTTPILTSQASQDAFAAFAQQPYIQQDIYSSNTQQQPTPFTLNPVQLPPLTLPSEPLVSPHRSMSDSDDDDAPKRKRKSSTSSKPRKSSLIGTHAIENTGAPVKMAKYLHVDGLTTQVWIEHAVYEENGVRTDVRMIMYSGAFSGVVVHAGDVGERIVCNRRSNISREFGQYASPNEKILIRVPSEHRPLGQTGNVLTGYGLIRFMQSKKMRKSENQGYRRWLLYNVYAILQARPFTFPVGHPLETRTTPEAVFTEADFSH